MRYGIANLCGRNLSDSGDYVSDASGIELVMVNGRAVWQAGAGTGARPGRALRLQELGPKGRDREVPV